MLEQSILWRKLDSPGHDACGVWACDNGWHLAGAAVFCSEGQPCKLEYKIDCDLNWHTRSASVMGWFGTSPVKLEISATPAGFWIMNGEDQSKEVAGLVDVDLGFTPATNLIHLRRIALEIGQEIEAPVAYLNFPAFTMGRLQQFYRRTALDKYDYRAPAFDYAAVLQVSDFGFVTDYPGLWKLEALK